MWRRVFVRPRPRAICAHAHAGQLRSHMRMHEKKGDSVLFRTASQGANHALGQEEEEEEEDEDAHEDEDLSWANE